MLFVATNCTRLVAIRIKKPPRCVFRKETSSRIKNMQHLLLQITRLHLPQNRGTRSFSPATTLMRSCVQSRSSAPPPLSFVVLQNHFRFTVVFLPSVNFLHLPDDLLLEEGQDGVVLAHLLEHHAAVELVAHLLEIIPGTGAEGVSAG